MSESPMSTPTNWKHFSFASRSLLQFLIQAAWLNQPSRAAPVRLLHKLPRLGLELALTLCAAEIPGLVLVFVPNSRLWVYVHPADWIFHRLFCRGRRMAAMVIHFLSSLCDLFILKRVMLSE